MDKTVTCARHWNNNQVCSIQLETTGPNPAIHEIIQLAVLPVNGFFEIRREVLPFYVNIKPDYPNLVEKEGRMTVSKKLTIMADGFDAENVKEMFYNWIKKLELAATKWGTPKQIYPMGHNYARARMFLYKFLGPENYEELFGDRYLDVMVAALYLNDRASFHGELVPFSKVDISWLAKQYNIDTFGLPDALIEAKIVAEVYRNMCKRGLF